jgi:hypothetical protein
VLAQVAKRFEIGQVESLIASVKDLTKKEVPKAHQALRTNELEVFGDLAPFAEPYWYNDQYSACGF